MAKNKLEIIGHRGAKGLAPENSIEAIRAAIKHKVDMIEVDVRMQGNSIVLSHDKTSTGQAYCPLRQALVEIDGKTPLNIEIKETKAVRYLQKPLENYSGEVLLSSKKLNILQEAKKLLPEREIAVIEKWSGMRGVAEAGYLGVDRIHMNHNWLWSGFVRSVINQGFILYAYTVNDAERAKELASWGVKGVFTDYPNKLIGVQK